MSYRMNKNEVLLELEKMETRIPKQYLFDTEQGNLSLV